MKYKLDFLYKEADLNKILSKASDMKASSEYPSNSVNILFVSLWDKWCASLVAKLKAKYSEGESLKTLYVVNSFDMPHSFMVFGTKLTPTLVKLGERRAISIDRLPLIYSDLGL